MRSCHLEKSIPVKLHQPERSHSNTMSVIFLLAYKNALAGGAGDSWILVWSHAMIEVFLELLEEAHDNGKRNDSGFKPEARVGFRAGIQAMYKGDGQITTGKIKSKLIMYVFLTHFL